MQTAADGAVCLFSGVVREDSRQRTVRYLEYDAYPEMAERQMRQILDEVRRKWPQQQAAIVHRIGRLEIGEASVVIAVASPHRGESLRGLPLRHRPRQARGAHLEEGGLHRRRGLGGGLLRRAR